MRYIFINTTNITSLATILSVNHKHPNIWLWGVDDYWNESGWQVLHRGFLSYGRGTEYFDGLPCPMGFTACWLGEEDSPNDRRWKKTLPTIRTVKKGDASPRSSPEGEDVDSFGNSFCPGLGGLSTSFYIITVRYPFGGVWKIRAVRTCLMLFVFFRLCSHSLEGFDNPPR